MQHVVKCRWNRISPQSQQVNAEGPTEDPFHLREKERMARELPIEQAKSFDEMIRENPSADEVRVRMAVDEGDKN